MIGGHRTTQRFHFPGRTNRHRSERDDRQWLLSDLWDKRTAFLSSVFIAAAALLTGYLYNHAGFWMVVGGLVVAATTAFLFSSPRTLILTVFVAKPLIDMLWFASSDAAGISLNAQSLVSVVILAAALITIAVRRIPLPRSLFLPMLAVVAINLWAVLSTPGTAYAAQYMVRIVCGFPLVFVTPIIVRQLPDPPKMLQLFFGVMAIVCLTVLLQPLGLIPYRSFDQGGTLPRATGFYYHPWDVARYMIILIPLLLAVLDDPERRTITRGILYWPLLAMALAVTYFTYLKAAWLAVLFQVLLWFYLTGRKKTAFWILIVSAVMVAFPLRSGFVSVFSDLWKLATPATRGEALSGRVFLWSQYWDGLRHAGLREILLGQGYLPRGWATTGAAVHDDYLRVLVMNGVVGLLAYLGLLIGALRYLRSMVRRLAARRGLEWRIGIAVQCLLGAYLLMGITADPSSYPSLTIYIWLLVGLVAGYAQTGADQTEQGRL
jgi:hypothetical protein